MSDEQVIQLLTEIKEILLRIERHLGGSKSFVKVNEKLKRSIVNKLQKMGALKRDYLVDTLKRSYSIQEIENAINDLKKSGMIREENGLLILLERKEIKKEGGEDMWGGIPSSTQAEERVKQIKEALSK
jgi:hypothetical protein